MKIFKIKNDNKGYMLVEMIAAFTITMAMVYFLMQILINLKNTSEDYFVDTKLETDQILMTRTIMNDVSNYQLKEVTVKNTTRVQFKFYDTDNQEFIKELNIKNNRFYYGQVNASGINQDKYIKTSLFTKEIDSRLKTSTPLIKTLCLKDDNYVDCSTLTNEEKKNIDYHILSIKMSATTIYSDKDYGININIPYSKQSEIKITMYDPCNTSPISVSCSNGAKCEITDNNKILKILSSGDIELHQGYNCESKKLGIALVGGGNGGGNGVNSQKIDNVTGTTTVGGKGGNGGDGGKVLLKNNYDLFLGTYKITVGSGGNSEELGTDSIIKINDEEEVLNSVTGTNTQGGKGGEQNIECANVGHENMCHFYINTSESGINGTEIKFNDINLGIFGSSGGGGGAGHKANYSNDARSNGSNGGTNAGKGGTGGWNHNDTGGYSQATPGENGIKNTGSGGGGGGGGGGYYYSNHPHNYEGAYGGKGGDGIIILYNDLGWDKNFQEEDDDNPCATTTPINFTYDTGTYQLLNNNKVLKLKTSGTLNILNKLKCEDKNIEVVLVDGGQAGEKGPNFSSEEDGGTGGSGGKIQKFKSNINKGSYGFEIGKGGSWTSQTNKTAAEPTNILKIKEAGTSEPYNLQDISVDNHITSYSPPSGGQRESFEEGIPNGLSGIEIKFDSFNAGVYGSSGGGGGMCTTNTSGNGGANAGNGGKTNNGAAAYNNKSGKNGTANTGAGGGGGADGCDGTNNQKKGGQGGNGGSGIALLYYEDGWIVGPQVTNDEDGTNPCTTPTPIKFAFSTNKYQILSNNKILKIKDSGTLNIYTTLKCSTKKIQAALVGGGRSGTQGTQATWAGSHFGSGFYYLAGSTGNGGNGASIKKYNSEMSNGTYEIGIGGGGYWANKVGSNNVAPGMTKIRKVTEEGRFDGYEIDSGNETGTAGGRGQGQGHAGNNGINGKKIEFDSDSDGVIYGSSGGGGGMCSTITSGTGGENAGNGGTSRDKNGKNGTANTGAGGGGGAAGCDGGDGFGAGGSGGSGVVLLYYEDGWTT